jgi:hypothetical protein
MDVVMVAGFYYNVSVNPYFLLFDDKNLQISKSFVKIWENNSLEELSERRRKVKFGLINKEEWKQLAQWDLNSGKEIVNEIKLLEYQFTHFYETD